MMAAYFFMNASFFILQLRCFNEEHGYTSVMAASDVFRHFQRECGHHSVSCPRCSAGVLCSDVCPHLRSGCEAKATPPKPAADGPSECKNYAALVATFRTTLEKLAAESKRLFECLAVNAETHGERLSEVSDAISILRQTLKQDRAAERHEADKTWTKIVRDITVSTDEMKNCFATFGASIINLPGRIDALEKTLQGDLVKEATVSHDHLSQIASCIKADVMKNTLTTLEKIGTFIGRFQETATVFSVKGVEELKQKALKEGSALYECQKLYMSGYCISPGVVLKQAAGRHVRICTHMVLHKCDMDDFLHWPFQHKVSLCVVHPKDSSRRKHVGVFEAPLVNSQRPTQQRNMPVYFVCNPLTLDDLIVGGFVEGDSVLVKFKVHA